MEKMDELFKFNKMSTKVKHNNIETQIFSTINKSKKSPMKFDMLPKINKSPMKFDMMPKINKSPMKFDMMPKINIINKPTFPKYNTVNNFENNLMSKLKMNVNNDSWLRVNQQKGLKPFGDKDKDGVPNILDCWPLDKKRQGILHNIFGGDNKTESGSISKEDVKSFESYKPEKVKDEVDPNVFTKEDIKGMETFKVTEDKEQNTDRNFPEIMEGSDPTRTGILNRAVFGTKLEKQEEAQRFVRKGKAAAEEIGSKLKEAVLGEEQFDPRTGETYKFRTGGLLGHDGLVEKGKTSLLGVEKTNTKDDGTVTTQRVGGILGKDGFMDTGFKTGGEVLFGNDPNRKKIGVVGAVKSFGSALGSGSMEIAKDIAGVKQPSKEEKLRNEQNNMLQSSINDIIKRSETKDKDGNIKGLTAADIEQITKLKELQQSNSSSMLSGLSSKGFSGLGISQEQRKSLSKKEQKNLAKLEKNLGGKGSGLQGLTGIGFQQTSPRNQAIDNITQSVKSGFSLGSGATPGNLIALSDIPRNQSYTGTVYQSLMTGPRRATPKLVEQRPQTILSTLSSSKPQMMQSTLLSSSQTIKPTLLSGQDIPTGVSLMSGRPIFPEQQAVEQIQEINRQQQIKEYPQPVQTQQEYPQSIPQPKPVVTQQVTSSSDDGPPDGIWEKDGKRWSPLSKDYVSYTRRKYNKHPKVVVQQVSTQQQY